jgi:hypothetical protein
VSTSSPRIPHLSCRFHYILIASLHNLPFPFTSFISCIQFPIRIGLYFRFSRRPILILLLFFNSINFYTRRILH